MHELVSLRALAEHLRRRFGDADPEQLRRDALAGAIPCVRIGSALAFNIDAVEAAILERARQPIKSAEGGK